jgi:putative endonuclease
MNGDDQVSRYTQNLGKWGEQLAVDHLTGLGYRIIATNHRTPFGEIDIIARDGDELVFIEVKTRSSNALGNPEGSITANKQQHILDSAQHYLTTLEPLVDEWRVDVVAITGRPGNSKIDIQVFQNALYF